MIRPAILRLAEQLRKEARRSGSHVDAVVADIVAAAWLFGVRGGKGKGSRTIEHAARALLATIDGANVAERATSRSLPAPGEWWDSLQKFAAGRRALFFERRADGSEQLRSAKDLRVARPLVAKAMVEHAIAAVPGVDVDREVAVARLLRRLDEKTPKDAEEFTRWTLAACEVPADRTNRAGAGGRVKRHRTEK